MEVRLMLRSSWYTWIEKKHVYKMEKVEIVLSVQNLSLYFFEDDVEL